jgi:Zn finger protein HypA/HybF involved in hydrogenase expression
MICMYCEQPIESAHAKKFCNSSCSAKYNNRIRKPRSAESRKKTSESIKALGPRSEETKIKALLSYSISRVKYLFDTPFDSLEKQSKRTRIIIEQEGKCAHCRISEWMGQPVCFEMDHIDGNNQNNKRDNLEILCPNCHSNTPTWKGRNSKRDRTKINEYINLRKKMVEDDGNDPSREP